MPEKQEQVAILFSDASGFSSLGAGQLGLFVSKVIASLTDVINGFHPKIKNTWGDAIFLVFATAQEAAECALALRDKMRHTAWSHEGITSDLKMRFALHNAHATILKDPLTQRPNAYGVHINQAARLEPVAIPNEIFATNEFRIALDAYKLPASFSWDEIGPMALAKQWGESIVYRLRRPNEQPLSATKVAELGARQLSLESLMPNALKLMPKNESMSQEVVALLKHADQFLFSPGVFRRNWTIHLNYDVAGLQSDGIITEYVEWIYELVNVMGEMVKYHLALIGAPDLEGKGGFISFHRILEDGSEKQVFPSEESSKHESDVFAVRDADIELQPQGRYKLEMRYSQKWPVSRDRPVVHNCFAPRETAFDNRLEIEAAAKKIGVLFGDSEIVPNFHKDTRYVFNIPSPILRDQVMELLLEF